MLEHGVGSGRVALPLARMGVAVTGIDHSRPMLDHFRALLKKEPASVRKRVTLLQGDMRTTRVPKKRFPLVLCPFNAALHLYTREDVEAWLASVHAQLEPRGELVFDISMPILEDLTRRPEVGYSIPPFEHPTAGRVRYREHFDYDRVRQILFVSMFFEPIAAKKAKPTGGKKKTKTAAPPEDTSFMTPLAHRQFYPCEMEALLHYNGFEVTALYGDFDRGPLVQRSDVMVWHAKPRSKGARAR